MLGQLLRTLDQFRTPFDTVDLAAAQALEEQIEQDEAQIRLARAVVGQRRCVLIGRELLQQRFDQLVQVIDLLELAARILVQAPFAREDVQFFQQLDGLARTNLRQHLGLRGLGLAGMRRTALWCLWVRRL